MGGSMSVLLVAAMALTSYVVFQWIGSIILKDASIVDRYWGGGFVVVAIVSMLYTENLSLSAYVLVGMVAVWGLRLSVYLTWRNWGHGEDFRYVSMRKRHGEKFWRVSLVTVFGLQGFLTWFIGLPIPIALASSSGDTLSWLDGIGIFLWVLGLSFESIGDWQLTRFKKNPDNEGRVLNTGLWRYTRHPNYFGDAVLWWGIFLVAVSYPAGILLAICPATMTFFLMRVSGVPMLERKLKKTRPEYAGYIERTSAFFPRMPK